MFTSIVSFVDYVSLVANIIPKKEVNAHFGLNSMKIKDLQRKKVCRLDTTKRRKVVYL